MKHVVLFFLGLNISFSFSQMTAIPDAAFEQYLISIGADTGIPDGVVPTPQISGISQLEMSGLGITDLSGIEDFAALTKLECAFNYLSAMDVSQNTNLQFLFCSYNQITSLDVSGCGYLFSLDCESNDLATLDLSMNPALTYLNCGQNNLTSLDISSNDLVLLACYQNSITSLDLTDHPDLEVLQCEDNHLTTLDLSVNPLLEFINVSTNQLTSLDISENTLVNEFLCSSNLLECLNVRNGNNPAFLMFDAENNPSLNCIEVDDADWSVANWSDSVDTGTEFSVLCGNACSSNQLGIKQGIHMAFTLYPNPAEDAVQLQWTGELTTESRVEWVSVHGQMLQSQLIPVGTTTITFDLQNVEAGIYFIRLIQDGTSVSQRLIIQ
jgi:hypothetical protein